MMNQTNYLLSILAWQKTKDGSKGKNAPKLFEPSFIKNSRKQQMLQKNEVEARDIDDVKAILSRKRVKI